MTFSCYIKLKGAISIFDKLKGDELLKMTIVDHIEDKSLILFVPETRILYYCERRGKHARCPKYNKSMHYESLK